MAKIVKIEDEFCLTLKQNLAAADQSLQPHVPFVERGEMLKFLAGLYIVHHVASGGAFPAREQLNFVLRTSLGTGYTWYTCMQFLSGARARTVFANRQNLFRELGGTELMYFANHVLPDMAKNFHKIFAPKLTATA